MGEVMLDFGINTEKGHCTATQRKDTEQQHRERTLYRFVSKLGGILRSPSVTDNRKKRGLHFLYVGYDVNCIFRKP